MNLKRLEKQQYRVKSLKRLEAITQNYDFTNKRVLDIGCDSGFFAKAIALKAKEVNAFDKNKHPSWEGCKSVDFFQAELSPKMLSQLPQYDVTLCLSVMHHLIAPGAYGVEWQYGYSYAISCLRIIREISHTLIFEIGGGTETSPQAWKWATLLPPIHPVQWGMEVLIDAGYHHKQIKVIEPPAMTGFQRYLHANHYTKLAYKPRWLQTLLNFDFRDNRPLFIATS